MSFKTFLQILIICLISVIIGTVYLLYFKENDVLIEKQNESIIEKQENELILKKELSQNTENKKNILLEEKKLIEENDKIESKKNTKIEELESENLLNEVEYVGTDKKGNKYKIFAKSGKTNKDDNSSLDLTDVRGIVSSDQRPNIYIVSDFAIYNSSNLNSNFYQNVIINYEEKQIDCDFFDLNMKTNFATAYGNVIVTDPTSIMRAGKINLNIKTKDIEITPEKQNKVKVLTDK